MLSKLRFYYPMISAFLLVIIGIVPFYIFYSNMLFPLMGLIVIFFWSSYHPAYFPYWFVFLLGLLQDVLVGTSLGISAIINVVFCLLINSYRDKKNPTFNTLWSRFALLVAIIMVFKWIIIMFLYGQFLLNADVLLQVIITIVSYPFFHKLLWLTRRIVPQNVK